MDQEHPHGLSQVEEDPQAFAQYAVVDVQSAVACASITRAHGALLAALRPDVQVTAVQGLLSMPMLPGVGDLKASIQHRAIPLTNVNFDKADCVACQYNSDNHVQLFGLGIDPGFCVNAPCAAAKTAEAVEEGAAELRKRYRVVEILPVQYRCVAESGDSGVGATQSKHCTEQCPSFGAAIGCHPGQPVQVVENVCINADCNDRMVEFHRQAQLQEFKARVWRHVLQRHVQTLPPVQNRAVALAFLALGWDAPAQVATLLGADQESSAQDLIKASLTIEPAALAERLAQLAGALVETAPVHQVGECIRALGARIQDHWTMTPAFLMRLSIGEVDAIAGDLRIGVTAEVEAARATGSRIAYAKAVGDCLLPAQAKGYVPASLKV